MSYIKAIDVWLVMCLAMVVAAFLEYAVINVLHQRANRDVIATLVASGMKPSLEALRVSGMSL